MLKVIFNHLFAAVWGTSTPGVLTAVKPKNENICFNNDMGNIIFSVSFSKEVPSSQAVLNNDKLRLPLCKEER